MGNFRDQKLGFYLGLRKDELVKRLGVEGVIRDLTEEIILYAEHVEMGCALLDAEKAERLDCPLEESNPGNLNFSDVKEIAYSVGIFQDERSGLWKLISTTNPLKEKEKEYRRHYEILEKENGLDLGIFDDEETADYIRSAMDTSKDHKERKRTLKLIDKKGSDYDDRCNDLFRLEMSADMIRHYYSGEAMFAMQGFISNGEIPREYRSLLESELTLKDIRKLTGYFKGQAEINWQRCNILDLTRQKIKEFIRKPNKQIKKGIKFL